MQIKYDKTKSELISVENEENNVTIDNTLNEESVNSMVSMYNEDYSTGRIRTTLESDEKLTGDEVDHLMEALAVLEEADESGGTPVAETPWTEDDIVASGMAVVVENVPDVTTEKPAEKVKKTRQPRTAPVQGNGKKVLTPQEFIAQMEEKIELCKMLSDTVAPEIPEGLTKAGRTLMIEFINSHEKLIAEYLEKIQQL